MAQLTAVPLADTARSGPGAGRLLLGLLAIVVVGIAVQTVVRLNSQPSQTRAEPTAVARGA